MASLAEKHCPNEERWDEPVPPPEANRPDLIGPTSILDWALVIGVLAVIVAPFVLVFRGIRRLIKSK